jgi:hypothetical protein
MTSGLPFLPLFTQPRRRFLRTSALRSSRKFAGRARSQGASAREAELLSAPDGTPCGLGASAFLLRGALLLRGRLLRNWLPRFRGSHGLNRHHLSIIRINRLYFRLYGVLLPLGWRLEATSLLLPLGWRLEATILLLPLGWRLEATSLLLPLGRRLEATILLLLYGVLLPEGPPLLLVGTDDPAISVDGAALAHAPATDRGASTRALSYS